MEKNKGVTLIELIVVVAILGVLIGGIALSLNIVNSTDINSCTQALDSSLEKTKNECMTKAEQQYLVLYKSADPDYSGYYVGSTTETGLATYTNSPKTDRRIGGAKLQISVTLDSGTVIDVTSNPVFVAFDRATGAFRYIVTGAPPYSTGSYPVCITVSYGAKKSIINCVQATGKHFVE